MKKPGKYYAKQGRLPGVISYGKHSRENRQKKVDGRPPTGKAQYRLWMGEVHWALLVEIAQLRNITPGQLVEVWVDREMDISQLP